MNPRIIAFYLPQFYPTPENDLWWQPGFTEWTNVTHAKPLYKNHYQPRFPRELGFYDLRVSETREKQAALAREAGIEGFCYWHYWFGNGKRLLSEVFQSVLDSGKPNYPFCLCWANHSWYAKTWNQQSKDKLLIEQTYPGKLDYEEHFYAMLPAFKDNRYIRVNGRPLFGIFDADNVPNVQDFFETWNNLAKINGLEQFYFFGFAQGYARYQKTLKRGYDTVVYDCLYDIAIAHNDKISLLNKIKRHLIHNGYLHVTQYSDYVTFAIDRFRSIQNCIPCIDPNFDHSPRSGDKGIIMHGSTPHLWGRLLQATTDLIRGRTDTNSLMFIKAWNEWGEGNYLEPDERFGKQYIETMARILSPNSIK